MAILGRLASINCDFDLNLGLFRHLPDEYIFGNFQVRHVLVQDHASVIWPKLIAIVGKLYHLLKLFLGGRHYLIVRVFEGYDLERDLFARFEL